MSLGKILRSRSSAKRESQSQAKEAEWLKRAKLDNARVKTAIRQARAKCHWDYEFRGNMGTPFDEAIKTHEEILLCGAAGTGKTLRILILINWIMWAYPGARALIVRKVRADLAQSTLVTFERDVMGLDNPVVSNVQRQYRLSYKYPNGSEIVVGGMDRPGAILSAEYDIIYVPEAVQVSLADWETLLMRLSAGPYPHPIIIGDTNPDRPDHWLKQRADGGLVKLLNTYHKDNPAWWDHSSNHWTAKGESYVKGKLSRLTGVRKERYLHNRWAIAEGAIYEDWNEDIHLIDAAKVPPFVRRWRAIDFGYIHPLVVQWWGMDHDGRMYRYREIYQTHLLVADVAVEIFRLEAGLSKEELDVMAEKYKDKDKPNGQFWRELRAKAGKEPIEFSVADHDAEDRATLAKYGIVTKAANKAVRNGIQAMQERLRVQGDGKPRIFYVRGARVQLDTELKDAGKPTCTEEEMGGYVWSDSSKKEEPIKEDDHGADASRYSVMAVDRFGKPKQQKKNPFYR
jgi:PBSX family phage terminase large subunit